VFRPFHRKLAGSPPGIAYVGLKWSWSPRIWDPQASSSHLPVHYSSPSLPLWLSWTDDVLSGIPPPDAESCDITTEARVRTRVTLNAHPNKGMIITVCARRAGGAALFDILPYYCTNIYTGSIILSLTPTIDCRPP
jgi:hypothetical protein